MKKKLIFLKCANWAKNTWPLAQFFLRFWQNWILPVWKNHLRRTFQKEKVFPSTCLDREQKKFGLLDKISRKDVKISFYVSTRTIWGNFRLKFCFIFNFFSPLSKNFVEESRWEASPRVVGNNCHQQRYTEEALLTFPKVCGFEKQNISQASRSFSRSLLSHSEENCVMGPSVGTRQCLSKTAHVCTETKMMTYKKVQEIVWFRKKTISMKQKKQSLSRATFLLHETPAKNRLNFSQRGRRKIPQRTKLKLIVTVHLAAAGFFFIFRFCYRGLLGRWRGVNSEEETINIWTSNFEKKSVFIEHLNVGERRLLNMF